MRYCYSPILVILIFLSTLILSPCVSLASGDVSAGEGQNWWQRHKAKVAALEFEETKRIEKLTKARHRRALANRLAKGLATRLGRRTQLWFWIIVAAPVGTFVYLCEHGGVGCDGKDKEKKDD